MKIAAPADPVIVAAYKRPELLWLCLERLRVAERPKPISVRVVIDNHDNAPHDPENLQVCKAFPDVVDKVVVREPHSYLGNRWNVLTAYREAHDEGSEYIFNVECDVMIATDFFRWHYAVQKLADWFCSIAATHLAYDRCVSSDPSQYYWGTSFSSLGVCMRSENVLRLLPHASKDYFAQPAAYLERTFPLSRFAGKWHSQDGLINRVMEQTALKSVSPCRPRAFHAGFYGFNRDQSRRPTGRLEQRVAKVREVIANRELLTLQYKDCEPCPLDAAPWGRLADKPVNWHKLPVEPRQEPI